MHWFRPVRASVLPEKTKKGGFRRSATSATEKGSGVYVKQGDVFDFFDHLNSQKSMGHRFDLLGDHQRETSQEGSGNRHSLPVGGKIMYPPPKRTQHPTSQVTTYHFEVSKSNAFGDL